MGWYKNMSGQDKVNFWGIMAILGIVVSRNLKKATGHKGDTSIDLDFDNDNDVNDTIED